MSYENLFWEFMGRLVEYKSYEHPPEWIKVELNTLAEKFNEESLFQMVYFPGHFFINDQGFNSGTIEELLNSFWFDYSDDELFDIFHGGDLTDAIWDFTVGYVKRLKQIKPTVLPKKPANFGKIESFYNEALTCYGHGYNNAAVALSAVAVEQSLKELMAEKDENSIRYYDSNRRRWMDKGFGALIYTEAKESMKILSLEMSAEAKKINRSRNKIMHESETISENETIKNIVRAKNILVYLFSNSLEGKF